MQLSEVEPGREYAGAVVAIRDFGAFVNIGANTDGLLHISQVRACQTRTVTCFSVCGFIGRDIVAVRTHHQSPCPPAAHP